MSGRHINLVFYELDKFIHVCTIAACLWLFALHQLIRIYIKQLGHFAWKSTLILTQLPFGIIFYVPIFLLLIFDGLKGEMLVSIKLLLSVSTSQSLATLSSSTSLGLHSASGSDEFRLAFQLVFLYTCKTVVAQLLAWLYRGTCNSTDIFSIIKWAFFLNLWFVPFIGITACILLKWILVNVNLFVM